MRRKDREVTDLQEIIGIMKKCDVCSLALFDKEYPYVIPLNFGVEVVDRRITLYFHSALTGKKLDLIAENNKVAFEMNGEHRLILGEVDCNSTMEFESVCGNGTVEILKGEEKKHALTILMSQYSNKKCFEFEEEAMRSVVALRLQVQEITAKRLKRK